MKKTIQLKDGNVLEIIGKDLKINTELFSYGYDNTKSIDLYYYNRFGRLISSYNYSFGYYDLSSIEGYKLIYRLASSYASTKSPYKWAEIREDAEKQAENDAKYSELLNERISEMLDSSNDYELLISELTNIDIVGVLTTDIRAVLERGALPFSPLFEHKSPEIGFWDEETPRIED